MWRILKDVGWSSFCWICVASQGLVYRLLLGSALQNHFIVFVVVFLCHTPSEDLDHCVSLQFSNYCGYVVVISYLLHITKKCKNPFRLK